MLEELWPELSADCGMQAIGSILSRDEMERRRLDAARDLMQGLSQSKVARKYGVSRTTASRWHRALSQSGAEALRKRRATGRPPRLTPEQFRQIPQLYALGASHFGFPDNRWTTVRLAAVIERTFGVRYDNDHVGRLMSKLGLRSPRPRRRAVVAPVVSFPAVVYPAAGEVSIAV
jgi:transposase